MRPSKRLRSTTSLPVYITAKDFCKFISEYEFVFEGERISVTISIGIALNRYFDTKLFSKYIGRADNMLYEAKAGGRNQVAYDQQLQTNY